MIVAIDVSTRQEIEGMAAVVGNNRSQLKAGKGAQMPRAIQHGCEHHFVPLIKVRQGSFRGQVHFIECGVITVEIGGVVEGFAVSVIGQQ